MSSCTQIISKDKIAAKYLPLLKGEVAALTELKHPNIVSVKVRIDCQSSPLSWQGRLPLLAI